MLRDAKRRLGGAAENSRAQPLPAGPLAVRSPSQKAVGATLSGKRCRTRRSTATVRATSSLMPDPVQYAERRKRIDVFRCELNPQRCPEGVEAEDAQIFVEVTQPGRQHDRFDAGCLRALSSELPPPRLRRHRRRGRYRAGAALTGTAMAPR